MKTAYIKFDSEKKLAHINKEIYGHFSEHLGRCIYNGIYVGKDSDIPNKDGLRSDVVEALKEIGIPVLRWPGGCFADEYHWKDGIGDPAKRKKLVNTNWGGVTEDNSFGTHEFMQLCEELGCEPYIAGNVGSGTVRELSEWVEYMTLESGSPMAELRAENGREKPWKVKYLGIGNESWGCGGNMTPEFYAGVYKQYANFCKNCSGNELYRIACGPSASDYNWTEVMMKNLHQNGWWQANGLALHFYSIHDWNCKGFATVFDDKGYFDLMNTVYFTEPLIAKHSEIMDKYDPDVEVGLIVDEWGTWYDVEEGTNPGFLYQQNTMRDALVAAISLNIFNQHAKRVKMANLAQVVNVLQAVILTEGERMVKTPTWQVFKMFLPHHEAELIRTSMAAPTLDEQGVSVPMLSQSMSVKDGRVFLTVSNCSLTDDCEVLLDSERGIIEDARAQIITAMDIHDFNDFDGSEPVKLCEYEEFEYLEGMLKLIVPAKSVVSVSFADVK